MKFFTDELIRQCEEEEDAEGWRLDHGLKALDGALGKYRARLATLGEALPSRLLQLSFPFFVDDALLVKASLFPASRRLTLVLRCGCIPDGYFDLLLDYSGIDLAPESEAMIAEIARGTTSAYNHWFDAYCHEVDVLADGQIEHRIAFNRDHGSGNLAWFAVVCDDLQWERIERVNRRLPPIRDRFVMK